MKVSVAFSDPGICRLGTGKIQSPCNARPSEASATIVRCFNRPECRSPAGNLGHHRPVRHRHPHSLAQRGVVMVGWLATAIPLRLTLT